MPMTRQTKKIDQEQPKFMRVPPRAIELEEVVLGAILLDKDAIYIVIDILKPDAFYEPANFEIYTACLSLFSRQQPIDSLTVVEELRRTGFLESVGGPAYIAGLTMKVASSANLEYHARIIQQYYIRRQLILSAMKVEQMAYDDTIDGLETMDFAETQMFAISNSNNRGVAKANPLWRLRP